MKKLLLTLLLLLPMATMAQQDMMAQMQEMAQCMQSIDENELKALENDAQLFETKIKALCNNGERDEAQQSAIEFSQKMMSSPVLESMRKCTEKMPESMKGMMPDMNPDDIAKDYSNHHVCDEI